MRQKHKPEIAKSKNYRKIRALLKNKDNTLPYQKISEIIQNRYGEHYTVKQLGHFRRKYILADDKIGKLTKKRITDIEHFLEVIKERKEDYLILCQKEEEILKIIKKSGNPTKLLKELIMIIKIKNDILTDYKQDMQDFGYLDIQAKKIFDINLYQMQQQKKEIEIEIPKEILIEMGNKLMEYDNKKKQGDR